jgi:hypothetical protein
MRSERLDSICSHRFSRCLRRRGWGELPLWLDSASETTAKAAAPQNGADRGLSNPKFSRNLLLRLALLAQRLDLLGQPRIDNLYWYQLSPINVRDTLIATNWLSRDFCCIDVRAGRLPCRLRLWPTSPENLCGYARGSRRRRFPRAQTGRYPRKIPRGDGAGAWPSSTQFFPLHGTEGAIAAQASQTAMDRRNGDGGPS